MVALKRFIFTFSHFLCCRVLFPLLCNCVFLFHRYQKSGPVGSVKYDGVTEVKERFSKFTEENPVKQCLGEHTPP